MSDVLVVIGVGGMGEAIARREGTERKTRRQGTGR